MSATAMFFLKFAILLIGVYIIVLITPKLAAWIDGRKKRDNSDPAVPSPERVYDDLNSENSFEIDDKGDEK